MMPEFILLCRDKANALSLRAKTRPAHLEYIAAKGDAVLVGGPILDKNGDPAGSMLVISAADSQAAHAFAEGDPYARAGLFETVEVAPYRLIAGTLSKTKA